MTFRIYYTTPPSESPFVGFLDEPTLKQALDSCERLRGLNYRMVTMVAVDSNQVGLPGVAGVENGKLPDGSDYDWTKTDRVGAAFKSK
jgi:hypothetical protein